MYRKIILTCAAVVAAIGLAFATVPASAKSHHGNGSHHSSHKSSHKHGKHAHRHKHHHKHAHHKWHHHKHHHHKHAHHHHKHWCWHHKHHHHCKKWWIDYETTYVTPTYTYSEPSTPSYVYTKPAPSCTCLTKEYAPDGTVIFKDVCTKEMATSEPGPEKKAEVN